MIDDSAFREAGRFKKGHPGYNKPQSPPPSPTPAPPTDAETDFDAAVLHAAASFGRPGSKPRTGLAGYAASLRNSRPQDFAAMVTRAQSRRQIAQQQSAAAVPLTVVFTPCPSNFFLPSEQARAEWVARTGEQPVLVINNPPTNPETTAPAVEQTEADDTDDTTFSDDPDDDDDDAA